MRDRSSSNSGMTAGSVVGSGGGGGESCTEVEAGGRVRGRDWSGGGFGAKFRSVVKDRERFRVTGGVRVGASSGIVGGGARVGGRGGEAHGGSGGERGSCSGGGEAGRGSFGGGDRMSHCPKGDTCSLSMNAIAADGGDDWCPKLVDRFRPVVAAASLKLAPIPPAALTPVSLNGGRRGTVSNAPGRGSLGSPDGSSPIASSISHECGRPSKSGDTGRPSCGAGNGCEDEVGPNGGDCGRVDSVGDLE